LSVRNFAGLDDFVAGWVVAVELCNWSDGSAGANTVESVISATDAA
jgi:hypothetical protein